MQHKDKPINVFFQRGVGPVSKIAPLIVLSLVLSRKDQTIHEQLKMQDEINRLHMVIQKTEKAAWKEQQPKKRFELYTKLQEYKKQLEEITHGQA